MGATPPLFQQNAARLWVVSHNVDLRIKLLIALLGLGLAGYLLSKPEIRRRLESKLLFFDESVDGGSYSAEGGDAGSGEFVLPGSFLSLSLRNAPQTHYMGELEEDAGDREFRELVQSLAQGSADYDPWLSRAARELAYQGAVLGDSPPESVLSFILRSSGAPELSVAQILVRASGDDPKVIRKAIERALDNAPRGAGTLVIGVGEAATDGGPYDRRVVVVAARRNFQLETTTRQLLPGEVWEIRGRTDSGFHDAQASVLYPSLSVVDIPVDVRNGEFSLQVPAGDQQGSLRVSIDGVSDAGPFKLLQLTAEVGGEVPRLIEILVPEEENFEDVASAEARALLWLNDDRRRMNLPVLPLDTALSDIARAHSQEMRDKSFFAHLSATTGLAGDRLEKAGYRASAHGENLALNDSVYESQASLMESVGHRRNIINESMTHVGIGLAREKSESGERSWYLTQLFARKVQPFDAASASESMFERINRERSERGLPEVSLDTELTELASEGCLEALSMPLEDLPAWLAPKASKIARAAVAVSVRVFYEMDSLNVDATSMGAGATEIGISFLRDEDSLHGRTFVVIIVAE